MSTPPSSEMIAKAVIPHFLRTLMKIERERRGMSRQAASVNARWSSSTWGNMERNARNLQPHHWINIAAVLGLTPENEARRLNAFIGKHPSIWIEMAADGTYFVCERALTSPRRIKSKKVVTVYLDPARPALYYELSSYNADPEALLDEAGRLGFIRAAQPPGARETRPSDMGIRKDLGPARRAKLCKQINEDLPDEKLGLLERVMDKFTRFPPDQLARAYKHFSLSLTDK